MDRHGHVGRGGGEFSVGPNARTVVSLPEIRKMGRGLGMEEVGHGKREMSCGVSEWMAGSQNWNGGKKKEGDMHGEISKSRSVNCGLWDWKRMEREKGLQP